MEQAGVNSHGGASVAAQLFPDAVPGSRAAGAAPDAAAATPQQGIASCGAPGGETLRVLAPPEPAPPRRRRPPPSEEELARAARLQARPALGQVLISRWVFICSDCLLHMWASRVHCSCYAAAKRHACQDNPAAV